MKIIAALTLFTMGFILPECPDTPNCVSSQAKDPQKKVKPFSYEGHSQKKAFKSLLAAIKSQKRVEIKARTENHVKATVKSLIFGFIDDLEFIFEPENQLIQVRSASRMGYWDLGVNARRVENLRQAFLQNLAKD
jgi:uncharacterized protein (DUF1499 family)